MYISEKDLPLVGHYKSTIYQALYAEPLNDHIIK